MDINPSVFDRLSPEDRAQAIEDAKKFDADQFRAVFDELGDFTFDQLRGALAGMLCAHTESGVVLANMRKIVRLLHVSLAQLESAVELPLPVF